MFRFESFGSGSSGNAYYIQTDAGALLIDAGVGIRKLKKLFYEYGISLAKINAILVTHNHVDHVRSLGFLNNKDKIHCYMTQGVHSGILENPAITHKPNTANTTYIEKDDSFVIADMEITPFEVPHDSKDNVGYMIRHGETIFCLVTDCGHWTDTIEQYVKQATHLVVESNYDEEMLANGPYPKMLQNRIRNGNGHLANNITAEIIGRHHMHLKDIWLCHLSEKNNTPAKALHSAQTLLSKQHSANIIVLDRTTPSRLYELE